MIRDWLRRSLGAPVEAWLGRLERGVDEAAHRRQAARWLRAARSWDAPPEADAVLRRVCAELAGTLEGEIPVPGGGVASAQAPAASAPAPREDDPRALVLHLAALPWARPAPDGAEPGGGAPPAWTALADGTLRPELTLALLADACLGRAPRAARGRVLDALSRALEPKRWFARQGVPLGAANLLRALVAEGEGPLAPYASDVSERLLRHVEVQRERALRPCDPAPPEARRLERLRFTLALLDAAERWRDLRFLNAALKRSDLHHRELARRRARPGGALLAGLHYAAAVVRQERLLRELAP